MTVYDLIQNSMADLGRSLGAFGPELVLCATVVALLLARMLGAGRTRAALGLTLAGSLVALALVVPWGQVAGEGLPSMPIFSGMLLADPFSVFMRQLLLAFLVLFTVMTSFTGVPGRDEATEFYVLVVGATLGMCLMVAANHMLIVFLGFEMASVPSYVLAGLLKHRRPSNEAALKFAVFGAAAAGVMLYGISLVSGVLGSVHLPTMASQLALLLSTPGAGDQYMVLVLGGLMILAGLGFKISAVPFHFWAPDVFEGDTAEVGAFLSVASKAAALALLVRVAIGLGHAPVAAAPLPADPHPAVSRVSFEPSQHGPQLPEGHAAVSPSPGPSTTPSGDALEPARQFIAGMIALLAAITCTLGNLAAYGQTNIKRLLAYSTIAHAGYMMMPVAAAVALIGANPDNARGAVASLAFYLAIYLFMNLGAFTVAAVLRNATGSERFADYAGLIRRSPWLVIVFSLILFSLVGMPPLAGFSAKFAAFKALVDAGLLSLLVIGAVNTLLSLFYYVRIIKIMVFDPEPESRPAPTVPLGSLAGVFLMLVTLPVVVLGVWWDPLFAWAWVAASTLLD